MQNKEWKLLVDKYTSRENILDDMKTRFANNYNKNHIIQVMLHAFG